ncbi:MAG: hypothetical protein N2234_01145 [Planctomycetota bacterium]|nr:hypothetical protein [Planctomycetota bacterium]
MKKKGSLHAAGFLILVVLGGCGSPSPLEGEKSKPELREEDDEWLLIKYELKAKKELIEKALLLLKSYDEKRQAEGEKLLFELGPLALPAVEEAAKGGDAFARRSEAVAFRIRLFYIGEEPTTEEFFHSARRTIVGMRASTDFAEAFLSFGELQAVGAAISDKFRKKCASRVVSLDVERGVALMDSLKNFFGSADCVFVERFNSFIAAEAETADVYRFGLFVDLTEIPTWQRKILNKSGLKFARYNEPLSSLIDKLNTLTEGHLNITVEPRHAKIILDLVLPTANIYEQLSLIAITAGLFIRYRQASLVFCEQDSNFLATAALRKGTIERRHIWRSHLLKIYELWKQL